jgi:nickel transport protein
VCPRRKAARGAIFALLLAPLLLAHDIEIAVRLTAPSVVTRATYAGSDPVSFAEVTVYKPGSETEYQTGRTDLNGYFAFVPDGSGRWHIIVDDELGHRTDKMVEVSSPFESGNEALGSELSVLQKALIGIALIIGITGLLYGYKVRQQASSSPPKNLRQIWP